MTQQDTPPTPMIDALKRAVAAEHAAVFVYGVLGAQTSRTKQPALYAGLVEAYQVHQTRRDLWLAQLHDEGVEADAPPAAYDPGEITGPNAIQRRARRIESDCAETYVYVVANTVAEVRRTAADALSDAGVRGLGFGAHAEELPGL